jgi:hypothetical protein
MDLSTLKKKLSTYQSDAGRLKNVSDELLFEVLTGWENWSGTATEFYRAIGFSHRQMAKLIGKAKKLKREGRFGAESFKEVHVDGYQEIQTAEGVYLSSPMIELVHARGDLIRFPQVGQLLEYLKSAS